MVVFVVVFGSAPSEVSSPFCFATMPPRKRLRHDDPLANLLRGLRGLGIPHSNLPQVIALRKETPEALETDVCIQHASMRALEEECAHMFCTESITLGNGGPFVWHYLDPNKLMVAVLQRNVALATAVARTLRETKPPWALIWTADETYSENPLHESGRKTWGASFSFGACAQAQMCQSAFWFSPAVCRSKKLAEIPGGASRLFAAVLRRQLYNEEDGLCGPGLPITIGEQTWVLFARFHAFLGDGDSWKFIIEAKGASGLRPCPFDRNLWAKHSDMAHRAPGHVEITCHRKSGFKPHTTRF